MGCNPNSHKSKIFFLLSPSRPSPQGEGFFILTDNSNVLSLILSSVAMINTIHNIPIAFTEAPEQIAFEGGMKWAKENKPASYCQLPVQSVVGTWWSGMGISKIEFVWWYSPEYVSAMLGYLSTKEYWKPKETQNRWTSIAQNAQGKVTFLVQLAAMPRIDPLTGDPDQPANYEQLVNVRFVLVINQTVLQPKTASLVYQAKSRNRKITQELPWYQFAPGGTKLIGEFETPLEPTGMMMGEYGVMLYRVDFDLEEVLQNSENAKFMSFKVLSRSKTRVANFQLHHRR